MPIKVSAAWRIVTAILSLAAVYFLAGKFGLSLAIVHPTASAIWPPSGIALAALLLWGYRLWPGVLLGAFLVNITTQLGVLSTLAIASGNTLEALLGAWLINHFANGRKVFERARHTFKFVLLAALISTAVSATIGTTSLTLGGYAPWERYTAIWLTWWLGDATGDLLVTPLLVIWLTQARPELKPRRIVEASGLLLALLSVGYIVFLEQPGHGFAYVAILPLLWAAFRFGERGAVTAAFFTSVIALAGTVQGIGPFAASNTNESLLHLQGFAGTIAMAALVLASVITERMRAEQRLEVQEAVSRILADSADLKEAGPRILQVLCERAKWSTGALWNVDRAANALVCVEFWHLPSIDVPRFEATSRQRTFARGVGLPGRVWSSGNAAWIPDVTKDGNFPRAPVAAQEGLRGAFGFPIKVADEILAIIECFSREVREPDDDFLRMMRDIGGQVGRFIERKRSENDIAVLNQRLRAVLDTAADGIITIDGHGIIRTINAAAERIFGYTAAEIIGQNVAVLMPEPYRCEHDSYLRNYLRTGERKIIGIGREVQGRRKDGTNFPVDLAVSETRLDDYRAFTGIVRDITERKRTELLLKQAKDELLQANEQLEKRVQERTADLEQANAALLKNVEEQKRLEEQLRQAQKMESIGTLAGGIAHDFNNTLNIIRAYATLASAKSPTDPQIVESMTIINDEVDRGASVVRQLLTLARKTETRLTRTDANQVVVTVSELIKQTFPRTIDVRLKLDSNLPPVLADSNQINQALINICVNARDAMPTGGGLTLTTEVIDGDTMQSRHPEAAGDSHVCIAITDTGTGIEESVRSRIFEPFFTTKGFGEGTGLGLAMVYGILKNHQGIIDVDSAMGGGTTFRLYLPVFQADDRSAFTQSTDAKALVQSVTNPKGTVFVVEDERPMVRLLKNFLTRKGYRVLAAFDGAEAIDLYRQHKDAIDVVLMDLGLPKVPGSQVIRIMKEQNPAVKIIITTGYLEPDLKSELFGIEVKDYIQKPYSVDEILEKVESIRLEYC
jgi:PAS domain S-box-containing protein